ncbi:MAG: AraC family transcriptional regulator [Cyclobacteriaceae bacterium]|nr:AraC family transcriptional regulator [Cyclobacteriaceae bacterium HetDA_MAG_MS6]
MDYIPTLENRFGNSILCYMEQQRSVVIPDFEIKKLVKDSLNSMLYLTDIGFYPKASGHYRKRKDGCNQHILIYCVSGKGWISVNGNQFQVKENQYFVIPKKVPHSYGSDKQHPWSIYWLHYLGTLSDDFSKLTKSPQTILLSTIARMQNRIELFEEMLQNLEIGFSKENIQYANICLMHFLASFKFLNQYRQIRKRDEFDPIERSIRYMRERISDKLSLTKLSQNANLSPSQYSLLFKNKTGKPPLDYLIRMRVQRACQMLNTTNLKVKEIAHLVGYDDPYYFSRVFHKTMGTSPRDYRKFPKG